MPTIQSIAERVIDILYEKRDCYPNDHNTDDTITIGEWKAAIMQALDEVTCR